MGEIFPKTFYQDTRKMDIFISILTGQHKSHGGARQGKLDLDQTTSDAFFYLYGTVQRPCLCVVKSGDIYSFPIPRCGL